MKTCSICGKDLSQNAHNAKTCSPECRREHVRLRYHEKQGTDPARVWICIVCNTEFDGKTNANTCSPACSKINQSNLARKWYQENKERLGKGERRYKSRMWNHEDFSDPWLTWRHNCGIGDITDTQLFPLG